MGSNLEVTKTVFTGLCIIRLEFDIIESVVPVVKCFMRRCFAGLKSTRFRLVILHPELLFILSDNILCIIQKL